MRLDKYLQVTGLIKRRALANEACKLGLVKVNDVVAKATRRVNVGDLIHINLARLEMEVRVLQEIKGKSLKRSLRPEYFEVLKRVTKRLDEGFWDELDDEDSSGSDEED